ncbi:MAG: zf-HC2 domain-containing protein [Candidatus Omnitrophota bacterium]|nr:zf-HC2 domain-containing protein [Candidatus Omnitrophota bacterium]
MTKIEQVKAVGCPDEATLTAYLSGALKEAQVRAVEEHAATCHLCLENIRAGHLSDKLYGEKALPESSDRSIRKAKGIAKMKSNRVIQRNLWLVATISAFSLSFTVPKYFAQFLVAALILGLKWVSESESVRTLIIAMDAKRRHEQPKEETSKWRR